jgi:hypothetical protein
MSDITYKGKRYVSGKSLLDNPYDKYRRKTARKQLALTEEAETAETEAIAKEKLESEAAALEKKRGQRKKAAKRTGRRASILSGPLGAQGEPTIRRATLG